MLDDASLQRRFWFFSILGCLYDYPLCFPCIFPLLDSDSAFTVLFANLVVSLFTLCFLNHDLCYFLGCFFFLPSNKNIFTEIRVASSTFLQYSRFLSYLFARSSVLSLFFHPGHFSRLFEYDFLIPPLMPQKRGNTFSFSSVVSSPISARLSDLNYVSASLGHADIT